MSILSVYRTFDLPSRRSYWAFKRSRSTFVKLSPQEPILSWRTCSWARTPSNRLSSDLPRNNTVAAQTACTTIYSVMLFTDAEGLVKVEIQMQESKVAVIVPKIAILYAKLTCLGSICSWFTTTSVVWIVWMSSYLAFSDSQLSFQSIVGLVHNLSVSSFFLSKSMYLSL